MTERSRFESVAPVEQTALVPLGRRPATGYGFRNTIRRVSRRDLRLSGLLRCNHPRTNQLGALANMWPSSAPPAVSVKRFCGFAVPKGSLSWGIVPVAT